MESALIGDIGATNARFALVDEGAPRAVEILNVAEYPSLQAAIETYLGRAQVHPRQGALAVAGPVTGDFLSFTNHPWSFSIKELTRDLKFDRLRIVNDFVAVALAVPRLNAGDYRQIGPGKSVSDAPIAILGPGTGLGVSSVVPVTCEGKVRWVPLQGEGGHVTLATVGPREAAIVAWLHRTGREHISAERLLSGQGICTLYTALSALDGHVAAELEPAEITALARSARDPRAVETIATFCALLGSSAGNLALTVGARGGVYIAGGIVPQLGDLFDHSAFRARFIAKGRMQTYLEPIPTYVIINELPAFIGLAELVREAKPGSSTP